MRINASSVPRQGGVTVSEKEKDITLTTVSNDEADISETSASRIFQQTSTEDSLRPHLNELTRLNMPATGEAARLMQQLLAQHPGLTLEEAAFLASNKFMGNEDFIKAVLAVISGAEKTDELVERLRFLLQQQSPSGGHESAGHPEDISLQMLRGSVRSTTNFATDADSGQPVNFVGDKIPSTQFSTVTDVVQITDLLNIIMGNKASSHKDGGQVNNHSSPPPNSSITHSNGILQSTFTENSVEMMQEIPFDEKNNDVHRSSNKDVSFVSASVKAEQLIVHHSNPEHRSAQPMSLANDEVLPLAQGDAGATRWTATAKINQESNPVVGVHLVGDDLQSSARLASLSTRLSAILSEIPELKATVPEALEKFSEMLIRVADKSVETADGEMEKAEDMIDKLFTRLDKSDVDTGAKLKATREELFARLALVEEVTSKVASPDRAEILSQIQRLTEHVSILSRIESFVYMQLPISVGEQRKSAELYVFRKKGAKKPDPENVNILLTIDLENMGHWESLINIRNKEVSLQMEASGAKEKEHFSENIALLHELLAQAEFKLVSADIAIAEKETTPITALNTLRRLTVGKTGKIDFKI
ncbi:MAG: flagellar hook-length control protein FliK [Oscillospiraceae bacterium]|nr:flagellar hook-length control protein FliK [Oscillospiraceae bacterium]